MEHWQERIRARPENRDALMKWRRRVFIEVMSRWREYFLKGADLPVIGATETELRSIKAPACIVPGTILPTDGKPAKPSAACCKPAKCTFYFPNITTNLSARAKNGT
jgi:hypothetical protein